MARTVHLLFIKDARNGQAWLTKILADPVHDITLSHKALAPLALRRGELLDPRHAQHRH